MQVRSTEVVNGCREDVDTALLKLYAEQNHDSLLDLLASENACVLADSVPWLEKYHKCVLCRNSDFFFFNDWTYFSFNIFILCSNQSCIISLEMCKIELSLSIFLFSISDILRWDYFIIITVKILQHSRY